MSRIYKQQAAFLQADNKRHTSALVEVPLDSFSKQPGMVSVWRSNRFLVQVFEPVNGGQRISINRTMIDTETGRWVDGITWDEIMQVKRAIGFGDRDALEVYPADRDIVNVANLRHIWLVDSVSFAWRAKS